MQERSRIKINRTYGPTRSIVDDDPCPTEAIRSQSDDPEIYDPENPIDCMFLMVECFLSILEPVNFEIVPYIIVVMSASFGMSTLVLCPSGRNKGTSIHGWQYPGIPCGCAMLRMEKEISVRMSGVNPVAKFV